MPKSSKSSGGASVLLNKWFVFAIIVAVFALYLLGVREPQSTANCHKYAEAIARERLVERVKNNPNNKGYIAAAKANLYAMEDYEPVFKKCMLRKGYQVEN